MVEGATNRADFVEVLAKLTIELRILSDIAYRLEYAIAEQFAQTPSRMLNAELQLVDLFVQSTDALGLLTENLVGQCEDQGRVELRSAVIGITLNDMIDRLTGEQADGPVPPAGADASGVELF